MQSGHTMPVGSATTQTLQTKGKGEKKQTKRKIMYTIQKAGFVKPITVLWTELRIRPLPSDWNAKLIPGSPPCRNKENGT
uniref:Uncharacterized protein n=1 Tax=Anguilla anguilla TaxID=7936 RepID=A0A0E9RVH7_ANGAN